VSPAPAESRAGLGSPFVVFGVAAAIAAAFAIYMGVSFLATPDFFTTDFPTIAGVSIAVVLFLVLGARAPPNE